VKNLFALAALMFSLAIPASAAKNSQGFFVPNDVRAGATQIPAGHYDVSWAPISGSQVQLTIRMEGKKPITLVARIIQEKHTEVGVSTILDNGVTYLQDFHTTSSTFIIPGASGETK
jgi:hypothetical protein